MRTRAIAELLAPSVVLAALCVGAALAPEWLTRDLALDRNAVAAGEWWRLWTAHLVHFSARHAVLDASAALLLGHLAERFLGRRFIAIMLLVGAPLLSCVLLLLVPGLMEYRGASGLATVLGAIAGVGLWRARPRVRIPVMVLGIVFLAKLASDAFAAPMTLTNLPIGVDVAWQAHMLGIAFGLLAWAMVAVRSVRKPTFME
jgi:rhomboid family GlyGly-CTERM serine protease